MKAESRKIKKALERIFIKSHVEFLMCPFTYLSALILKGVRRHKGGFPMNWKMLKRMEVIPVINHYYDPLISSRQLKHDLKDKRELPGIEFNVEKQLELLRAFHFNEELRNIPVFRGGEKGIITI